MTVLNVVDDVANGLPSGVVLEVDYVVSVINSQTQISITQSNVYTFSFLSDEAGAIAGIVIGILVAIGLCILALLLFDKYKREIPKNSERELLNASSSPKTSPKPVILKYNLLPTANPVVPLPHPVALPLGRHKTVNIDYIMTGSRRVVVKDGNPTVPEIVMEEELKANKAKENEDIIEIEVEDSDPKSFQILCFLCINKANPTSVPGAGKASSRSGKAANFITVADSTVP
jgi:hypothetical protein